MWWKVTLVVLKTVTIIRISMLRRIGGWFYFLRNMDFISCVLKLYEKIFPDPGTKAAREAEKEKKSGLWDGKSEALRSKHHRARVWCWKWLWVEQGEGLLPWVVLPEVVASVGDNPVLAPLTQARAPSADTPLDSKRDCIRISRSLWGSGKRAPRTGGGREVMLLVMNCLVVSHSMLISPARLCAPGGQKLTLNFQYLPQDMPRTQCTLSWF